MSTAAKLATAGARRREAQPRQGRPASTAACPPGHAACGSGDAATEGSGDAATEGGHAAPTEDSCLVLQDHGYRVLQEYLATLPRDSYTEPPLMEQCVRGGRHADREGHWAELAFPPGCRLRETFRAAMFAIAVMVAES